MRRGLITRLLSQRTLRLAIGIMLLIEAVFIAESFTTIMRGVVGDGGSAWQLAQLLLLKSPEVVDFALPLVLMLSLYFAVTGARGDNELIICSAAGISWVQIPAFAFKAGLVGFAVSLLFSGVITPFSAYMMRLSQYGLQAETVIRHLTEPNANTLIREIEGRTVIATPSQDPDTVRGNLFIFEQRGAANWGFIHADDWTVAAPPDAGRNDDVYQVQLMKFREYNGSGSGDEGVLAVEGDQFGAALDFAKVQVSSVEMDLRIEQLIPAFDRVRRGHERYLPDLFRPDADPDAAGNGAGPTRRFAEILARALLCPLAAMIAVAAAAWSGTRLGRFAALPLATIGVMGSDVAARAVMGDAVGQGAFVFWSTTGIVMAALLAIPVIYILSYGERILALDRGQA